MKKYLIFRNNPASGKSNIPGSPEDIACDIAMGVEIDAHLKNTFIAYPADSPEATFATIQSAPLFSLELNQVRINTWINDAEPIREKILYVNHVIDHAYKNIMEAVGDLEYEANNSATFHKLDIVESMDISYGFEAISRPSEYEFSEHIAEYFDVKVLENHPVGRR